MPKRMFKGSGTQGIKGYKPTGVPKIPSGPARTAVDERQAKSHHTMTRGIPTKNMMTGKSGSMHAGSGKTAKRGMNEAIGKTARNQAQARVTADVKDGMRRISVESPKVKVATPSDHGRAYGSSPNGLEGRQTVRGGGGMGGGLNLNPKLPGQKDDWKKPKL